ncbi:MAG: glutathione S-transferase family protein, partial [Desulfobulbia bacterium]
AEPRRYVLYSSIACPWAHRAVIMRKLKNLEEFVELYNTCQSENGQGWVFTPEKHLVPGTDRTIKYLHQLYTIAQSDYTGRVTVPTLWDSKSRQIVSNESSEIMRMFNHAFNDKANPAPDFYPDELHTLIDETNEIILKCINNAVNECGRSASQEAYDRALKLLFNTLDKFEKILSDNRYICGSQQTEADWRLYPTLIRFDAVYYVGYKCNLHRLSDYPNLSNYLRDLYQTPGIKCISDVEEMKRQVYSKAGPISSNGIIPGGPLLQLDAPHNRDHLS